MAQASDFVRRRLEARQREETSYRPETAGASRQASDFVRSRLSANGVQVEQRDPMDEYRGWANSVYDFSNRMQHDFESRQKEYQPEFWRYQLGANKEIGKLQGDLQKYRDYFSTIDQEKAKPYLEQIGSYENYLKGAKDSLFDEFQYWKQFENEGQFRQEQSKRDAYDRYQAMLDSPDFKKYSDIGTGMNSTVRFAREGKLREDPHSAKDLPLYKHMTDDEYGVYTYLLGKGDKKGAEQFLDDIRESLNIREGQQIGSGLAAARGIGGVLRRGIYNLGAGMDSSVSGIGKMFRDEAPDTSVKEVAAGVAGQNLKGFEKKAYEAAGTVGGMIPSILASKLAGLAGATSKASQIAGGLTMGAGIAGNEYGEALKQGYDKPTAALYGLAKGATEFGTEHLIGGIPGLSALEDSKVMEKALALDNGVKRALATMGLHVGSEIAEEEMQLFLEPLVDKLILKKDYELPTIEEMANTAVVTALSTGVLSVPYSRAAALYGPQMAEQMRQEEAEKPVPSPIDAEKVVEAAEQTIREEAQRAAASEESVNAAEKEMAQEVSEGVEEGTDNNVGATEEAAAPKMEPRDMVERFSNTMEETGSKTIREMYNEGQEPLSYIQEMAQAYNAGMTGQYIDSQVTTINPAQRQAAYNAGMIDAQQTLNADIQKSQEAIASENAGFDYAGAHANDIDKATQSNLDRIGKKLGVKIEMAGPTGDAGWNGNYEGGVIQIASDAQNPVLVVASHEATHRMQEVSPTEYKAYRDHAVKMEADRLGTDIETLVAMKHSEYARAGKDLTHEQAMDEIVADFTEKMLRDSKRFQELVEVDRSTAQKVYDWVKRTIQKIKAALRGGDTQQAGAYGMNADELEKAVQLWEKALKASEARVQSGTMATESAKPQAEMHKGFAVENEVIAEADKKPSWSLKSMQFDILDGKMKKDLVEYGVMTEQEAQTLMDNISLLMDKMLPFAGFMDLNEEYSRENRPFKAFKPNSDPLYKVSLDFSTLCKKRLMTQYVMESLQTRLERAVSAEEQLAIRDLLKEYSETNEQIQVACALCYVEARRLKAPKQINRFLDDRTPVLIDYLAKHNKAYKKQVDAMAADMKESMGYSRDIALKDMKSKDKNKINEAKRRMNAKYVPTAEEQKLVDRANEIPRADFLNQGGLTNMAIHDPMVYDAFMSFVRNATKSKALESGIPYYYGDSKEVSNSLLEEMNAQNGLRHQSWSDFELTHLLDTITAIIDLSVRGAKIQSYTKVPGFVIVNGNTGMMINLSLIPSGKYGVEDGKLVFDPVEGMPIETASELRKKYHKTAGTIAIAINDEQLRLLLADPSIDYVIPYHTSGMNAALRRMAGIYGWWDYQSYQEEKKIPGREKPKGFPKDKWHKAPEFSEWFKYDPKNDAGRSGLEIMRESADRYLKLCEERGLYPKFHNTKGGTDLSKNENYWKVLIDRKMIDGDGHIIIQQKVKPIFDFDAINELVEKEAKDYDPTLLENLNEAVQRDWDNGTIALRVKQLGKKSVKKALKDAKAREDKIKAASFNKIQNGLIAQAVKPAKKTTTKKTDGKRLSLKQDQDYMAAVNSGDMKKAQNMVNEAARDAGYLVESYHGTNAKFYVFDRGDVGFHFGTEKQAKDRERFKIDQRGGKPWIVTHDFLKIENPLEIDEDLGVWRAENLINWLLGQTDNEDYADLFSGQQYQLGPNEYVDEAGYLRAMLKLGRGGFGDHYTSNAAQALRHFLKEKGYDGIAYTNKFEGVDEEADYDEAEYDPSEDWDTSYIAFDPSQVKLADPVTYDDDGNVIPLSERFKESNPDIRYSMKPSAEGLDDTQRKHFDYNQKQTEVGSRLKTLKGSSIARSKIGVGKLIGGRYYLHKDYATDVIPELDLSRAEAILEEKYPDFEYNCVMYDPKLGLIRFDEAPDFDTAREPVTGDYISVNPSTGETKTGHTDYIWHHKWIWVKNDYTGFDVKEAWEWSKRWLSTLTEVSDGNGIDRWNAQLDRFSLPRDDDKKTRYSLKAVEPVQPGSDKWQRGHTEKWFADHGFPLYRDVPAEQAEANKETGQDKRGGKHGTQISTTKATYEQLFDMLKEENPDWDQMRVLDASSGLGLGTRIGREMGFNVTDIEPFPSAADYMYDKAADGEKNPTPGKFKPNYTDYEELQAKVESGAVKQFDFIISNAVLNVIPQDTRDNLVDAMGTLLAPGGKMFVNVISKTYDGAIKSKPEVQRNAKGVPTGYVRTAEGDYSSGGNLTGRGHETFVWKSNSVQKVFSYDELVAYLEDALGDGYTVEPFKKFGMTAAIATKNEDRKYSLKGQTAEQRLEEQKREIDDLKAAVDYWRGQTRRTKVVTTDKKAVMSEARKLVRDYSADLKPDSISGKLQSLYDYLAGGKEITYEVANEKAREIAEQIVRSAVETDSEMYDQYKDLREYARNGTFSLSEQDVSSIPDYNAFRKQNMGRINIKKGPTNIDQHYEEMAQLWPEFFDAESEINPADQMQRLSDVLADIYNVQQYNPFDSNMKEAVTDVAADIMERFFQLPQTRKTFADRQAFRVQEAKAKGQQDANRAREEGLLAGMMNQGRKDSAKLNRAKESAAKDQLAALMNQGREGAAALRRANDAILAEKKQRGEDIKKVKEKYREKMGKDSEKRTAREIRAKIVRHVKALSKKLLNGTDKNHVAENLRSALATVLESINLESTYSIDPKTGKRVNRGEGDPTKRTLAFQALKAEYEKAAKEDLVSIDPALLDNDIDAGLFNKVISYADAPIGDMTVDMLNDVWTLIKAMEGAISKAGKALSISKFETTKDWAESFAEDTQHRRQKKAGTATDLETDMMNPYTYFYQYGEAGRDMFRSLRDAQDLEQVRRDQVAAAIRDVVKTEDVERLQKERKTFKTERGDTLVLTKDQIMNLYLLMKREQAEKHLMEGGLFQPEIEKDGKLPKVDRGTKPVLLSFNDLSEIIGSLTDQEAKIADGLRAITELGATWGNEASMRVYGYKKFREGQYWPIKSAKEVVKETAEKTSGNAKSISNIGFAKPVTPGANNAIEAVGIFRMLSEHMGGMIKYSTWLAPMEDFNHLFNFRFREDGATVDTLKGILTRYGGSKAQEYWTRLGNQIQNGLGMSPDGIAGVANRVIGHTKGAAVGANLRVVIQQPTAIFRALAVIDGKYLAKGIKKGATAGNGWKKALKYAPIARIKEVGGFDQGTPQSVFSQFYGVKSTMEKASDAMSYGAAKADEVTWGKIWNACEWLVADKTNLVPGSEAFYKRVAREFTEVIDQTQVVDGVLQRAQVMRTADGLAKQLTGFMGEPLMSANMAIRSYDDYRYTTTPAARTSARQNLGRTIKSLVIADTIVALAQSVIDATRDDDPEKKYWERFLTALTGITGDEKSAEDLLKNIFLQGNLMDTMNPIGRIPYAKDLLSIYKGFKIERMDAAAFGDIIEASQAMVEVMKGDSRKTPQYVLKQLLTGVAKVTGIAAPNILRDGWAIVRSIFIETEAYYPLYVMTKQLYDVSNPSNLSRFGDVLNLSRKNDPEAHKAIYNDLLKHGISETKIASAMERAMKAEQGVTSASDLQQRYVGPANEKRYQEMSAKLDKNHLMRRADEKAQKKARGYLYDVVMQNDAGQEISNKVDSGRRYGVDEMDYILYQIAKDMASTDGNNSTSQGEAKAALDMMDSLSEAEKRFLWQTTNAAWTDKNNPWAK